MWQERITIQGPYAFDRALERMSIDPLINVDRENLTVRLPYDGLKRQALIIQSIGTTEDPTFLVSGRTDNDKEEAVLFVSDRFQWGKSLTRVGEHFSQTNLSSIFEEHRGTPLVLDSSIYSGLIKSIIHQQLNMKFASVLTRRFVTTYGEKIDDVWFYPSAERVAAIKVEELREMQFSQRKAEYVIGIGEKITSGELHIDKYPLMSDEEIMAELIQIRGIGPWTAQNVLLFGLGRLDVFPFADMGIQNALKKQFKMERKPTMQEMEQWIESWKPYLSYASLYLWRSIETGK